MASSKRTIVWMVLGLVFGTCFADYPPHDLYYRTHHLDLYPQEGSDTVFRPVSGVLQFQDFQECTDSSSWWRCMWKLSSGQVGKVLAGLAAIRNKSRPPADSDMCQGKTNGMYHHQNPDLGDPRCTFIACTNGRTVVQSCPRGTRTGHGLGGERLSRKSRLLQHQLGARKYFNGAPYRQAAPPGVDYQYAETPEVREYKNQFAILETSHGVCHYHDSDGQCGHAYPWNV